MNFLRFAPALVLFSACAYSNYVPIHAPHAPLLDHAGQVDVAVRGGVVSEQGESLSAHVAYAPIDHFEVLVSGDIDPFGGQRHYAGGVGVGTFARHDMLRLEAIGGVTGGFARGRMTLAAPGEDEDEAYRLRGNYLTPYAQVLVGFEIPFFELAGGGRISGFASSVEGTGDTARFDSGYERLYVESILTLRVPLGVFRFELTGALSLAVAGDSGPQPGATEVPFVMQLNAGIGFQFDTIPVRN